MLQLPGTVWGDEYLDLTQYVALALRQNDASFNLNDAMATADLEVASAAHQFRPQLVPLANIGVTSGDSNQLLGLEVQQGLERGTKMTVGVVGNRIENDAYVVSNSHSVRAYARISQPLYRRWGEEYNRFSLTRAELQKKRQAFLARRTRQEIIQGSIQKYYATVLGRLQNGIAEKSLDRSRQYLEMARSRQMVGLVSKNDVYRAELASLRAETTFLDQTRILETAEDALRENISLGQDWNVALDETIALIVPILPDDWRSVLPEQRPEWQAQLIDHDLSGLAIFKAERDLLPDLSLNILGEQKGQGESFDEVGRLDETNWAVQLQLNSTFDNFNEKASLTKAKMASAKLRRESNALERRIKREARQAFQTLLSEQRRLDISLKSKEEAGKALDLSLTRYERGLSDNVELLDAETAFAAAELDIIQNRVAYNLSAVRLAFALGVLDLEWLRLSLLPIPSTAAGAS